MKKLKLSNKCLTICCLLISLCFIVFITGCQRQEKKETLPEEKVPGEVIDEGPVHGDWLIRNLGSDPETLNPVIATDLNASYVGDLVFDDLMHINKDLELIPGLATQWEISDDHLVYTFHLRKDVLWHDGEKLTSQDVKFTFDRIMDPKVRAENKRADYLDVKELKIIDDYTFQVTYQKPFSPALYSWAMTVIPKHVYGKGDFNQHWANRKPVGSGPYRFVEWETGKRIVLEANPDYWGGKPYIDRVIFKMIGNPTASFNALKKGELDVVSLRSIQWVKQTNDEDFKRRFQKLKYYMMGFSYIGWNGDGSNPFFNDKRVRQAMTHALDRHKILDKLFYGLGMICTGSFYHLSWAYNNEIKPYEYDLEKAALLLEETGWRDSNGDGVRDKEGKEFKFTFFITSEMPTAEQIATILKEDLRKIGVVMSIQRYEWATFLERVHNRDFEAVSLGWSLSIDPDPYMLWHSSQRKHGLNYVGYNNPEVDRICELGRETFDRVERQKLYHRLHEILHEEQPYTFLYISPSLVAIDRRFRNVEPTPKGIFLYRPGMLDWYVPLALQKYRN